MEKDDITRRLAEIHDRLNALAYEMGRSTWDDNRVILGLRDDLRAIVDGFHVAKEDPVIGEVKPSPSMRLMVPAGATPTLTLPGGFDYTISAEPH